MGIMLTKETRFKKPKINIYERDLVDSAFICLIDNPSIKIKINDTS